jgi:hypothetical protein
MIIGISFVTFVSWFRNTAVSYFPGMFPHEDLAVKLF